MRPPLAVLLVALALVWAQSVAVLHAVEHLDPADDPAHPACELCLAHAQAGAPPAAVWRLPAVPGAAPAPAIAPAPPVLATRRPTARDPPPRAG